MTKRLTPLFVAMSCLAGADLTPAASLEQAMGPLQDGIPEVAVERLQDFLSQASITPAEKEEAQLHLTEAFIESGRATDALALLEKSFPRTSGRAAFWRGQAFASLARWHDALEAFTVAASNRSSRQDEALFGQAEALRALGRTGEAENIFRRVFSHRELGTMAKLRVVELLLDRDDFTAAEAMLVQTSPEEITARRHRRFLRGRMEAGAGRTTSAINAFSAVLRRPEGVSHRLLVATLLLLADTHLARNAPEEAAAALERYIEERPSDSALPALFAKLEEAYQRTRRPWRNELGRWARDAEQPRRAFSQWYLARAYLRAGRAEEAVEQFAGIIKESVATPAIAAAYVEYARLLNARRQPGLALEVLAAGRNLQPSTRVLRKIRWLEAAARMAAGDKADAARKFEAIAETDREQPGDALYNAGLGWLSSPAPEEFAETYQRITNLSGAETMTADLLLEKGLAEARQGNAAAIGTLHDFVKRFPDHARASEGWVALAELSFTGGPSSRVEARRYLDRATQNSPTAAARERASFLRVFLAEPDDSEMIKAAREFLQQHPHSQLAPGVQMKLGEAFFRAQDFSNAQTHFEQLARQHADHPLAEKALFFAAQAARSTMAANALDRAIKLFDEVAARNGELKWAARNEQAAVERRLGQLDQALSIYEDVLTNSTRAADRREALAGSGDIFLERGAEDPENFKRALDRYERLLNEAPAGSHWHNQALFKKGAALQKLGDKSAALEALYQVLEQDPATGRREFFWFYKAGFDAAELLEAEGKWTSAVAIYEKLAQAAGPRSGEADSRLKRLRLEHFLWE